MANVTRMAWGYSFCPCDEALINQHQTTLKSFLSRQPSMPVKEEVSATATVFQIATVFIGPAFNDWLDANRSGPRNELTRYFRLWAAGNLSDQSVFAAVDRDLRKVRDSNLPALNTHAVVQLPLPVRRAGDDNGNEAMLNLFTLLGPDNIASLILSLDGKA